MENIQHPMAVRLTRFFTALFLLGADPAQAQVPVQATPDLAAQVMVQQPAVDSASLAEIAATAAFDPPMVRRGEKSFYRVTVGATQNSIEWPDQISAPPGLKFGAELRGQLTQPDGTKFRPLTSFVREVTAEVAGEFTLPEFEIAVGSARVKIPAAALAVVETNPAVPPARKLFLEFSGTNHFLGEPFRARIISPAGTNNQIEALRDVQFNGGGVMADKFSVRMSAASVNLNGQSRAVFTYEVVLVPLAVGPVNVSAQAFTVPPFSAGPMVITSGGGPITLNSSLQTTPVFLVSDAAPLNVRPVPEPEALPGFTGAMGKFTMEKPLLATNRVRVGEPVKLKYIFNAGTNLVRFAAPPVPRSREWQVIEGRPGENVFTFIPLTDEATNTPAIPFCAFDFTAEKFYDLTIPAQPVTVIGDGLPVELRSTDDAGKNSKPVRLAPPATSPGRTVAKLKPLQLQGWFVLVQLLPLGGLFLLWRWDERRRFLEANPEIARRQKAKRDLARERKKLRAAVAAGDPKKFLRHAAAAMRIAVAPHFPAEARALVGADVLAQLDAAERAGNAGATVRKIFAEVDAQFSRQNTRTVSLDLAAEVERALQLLEEKL
jgi:hypothetical protein